MAEENGRENRNRKVIPYDQAFGAQNAGLTDPETNEGDTIQGGTADAGTLMKSPDAGGLRDLDVDDTKVNEWGPPPEDTTGNRDPEDIRSERNDAESAQEIAEPMPRDNDRTGEGNNAEEANEGNGLGITALILSLVSIFVLPAILAPAGIIVGYIAFRRGSRTTGIWAMVVGAFALLMALFILPAYFR